MSVEAFAKMIQNQSAFTRFKKYREDKRDKTWVGNDRTSLDAKGFTKYADTILTKELAATLDPVNGLERFNKYVASVTQNQIESGSVQLFSPDSINTNVSGTAETLAIVFPTQLYSTGLNDMISSILGPAALSEFESYKEVDGKKNYKYHRGHYVGVFTAGVVQTEELLSKSLSTLKDASGNKVLSQQDIVLGTRWLDILGKLLTQTDIATSNLKGITGQLSSSYVKTSTRLAIEVQLSSNNSESGAAASKLAGMLKGGGAGVRSILRNIDNPSRLTKILDKYHDNLKKLYPNELEQIAESRGSPSMVDLIAAEVALAMSMEKTSKDKTKYVAKNIPIGTIPLLTIDRVSEQKAKAARKKSLQEITKAKATLKIASSTIRNNRLRTSKGQFTSLAAINVLLNERLAEQIKGNMGKGNAHALLNNRTGRFAESANVNYLTQDRSGVITAFYTYMKSPYQTFEPGYEQGSPKSRDPKTLITKSIREIAISLATIRLRTVLV